jgi:hypothetical protein
MGDLFGGGAQAPDPFSDKAVAFRKWEREEATKSAREEHEWQRSQALEDREWQEDLEDRRATRKQKEEEERIRLLRKEQQQATETVDSMTDNYSQDADQSFTNMWSSLDSGVSGARAQAARSAKAGTSLGNAFSKYLTGDG